MTFACRATHFFYSIQRPGSEEGICLFSLFRFMLAFLSWKLLCPSVKFVFMALSAYKDSQHGRCAFSNGFHFIKRSIRFYSLCIYLLIYLFYKDWGGGTLYTMCGKVGDDVRFHCQLTIFFCGSYKYTERSAFTVTCQSILQKLLVSI